MKTRAAVLYEPGKGLEIEELDLDGPQTGEILIRYTYSGLCHSDLHLITGDMRGADAHGARPRGRGNRRAGRAGRDPRRARGPRGLLLHPELRCLPLLRHRPPVDLRLGRDTLRGSLPGERFPITGPRGQYGAMCMIGTFSQYGVIHQNSAVKVDDDLPLDKAVLLGCGVPTGWGSAVYSAKVTAGDTVADLRHRRHRHQRRPGRPLRRREERHGHRPAGEQAGEGAGARRHPRLRRLTRRRRRRSPT